MHCTFIWLLSYNQNKNALIKIIMMVVFFAVAGSSEHKKSVYPAFISKCIQDISSVN